MTGGGSMTTGQRARSISTSATWNLKAGENGTYDSYGDSQGDAVLEGAVYGLFAAKDLVHPDGKTGVVYRKNDLVAVASTDKNGDARFWPARKHRAERITMKLGRLKTGRGTGTRRRHLICITEARALTIIRRMVAIQEIIRITRRPTETAGSAGRF